MAPVPWNISTHLVSIQNCTKISYVYRINYIYENNHPPPLAHNTLSNTPTAQQLTFRAVTS